MVYSSRIFALLVLIAAAISFLAQPAAAAKGPLITRKVWLSRAIPR